MKELVIVGCGGFAAEITEYIEQNNTATSTSLVVKGYVDVDAAAHQRYGLQYPYLGSDEDIKLSDVELIIAIGDVRIRNIVFEKLKNMGGRFYTFTHHTANIAKSAVIGNGVVICPNVIIGPKVEVRDNCIFNYNSTIAHDCSIDEGNVFSPAVVVTGYVKIGRKNLFGVGSKVTPSVSIGNHNKIQAGVIVAQDIPDKKIVYQKRDIKMITSIY
tara:strand:- start:264 stop:908 length:645 start_codon:yes stop_codon:yes gene_type:complete